MTQDIKHIKKLSKADRQAIEDLVKTRMQMLNESENADKMPSAAEPPAADRS
jgi:predicted DNA-binding protein YlxM (UPF0122 family)